MGDNVRSDRIEQLVRIPQLWLAVAGLVLLLAGMFLEPNLSAWGLIAIVGAAFWWVFWWARTRTVESPIQLPRSTSIVGAEERAQRLDTALAHELARGWRIESRTTYNAVVVSGRRPNHVLHFLISFLTCGAWLIVWLLVALNGERRRQLAVDPYGNII